MGRGTEKKTKQERVTTTAKMAAMMCFFPNARPPARRSACPKMAEGARAAQGLSPRCCGGRPLRHSSLPCLPLVAAPLLRKLLPLIALAWSRGLRRYVSVVGSTLHVHAAHAIWVVPLGIAGAVVAADVPPIGGKAAHPHSSLSQLSSPSSLIPLSLPSFPPLPATSFPRLRPAVVAWRWRCWRGAGGAGGATAQSCPSQRLSISVRAFPSFEYASPFFIIRTRALHVR